MERIDLNTTALEPIQGHTSKGDQPKWQRDGKWYKADHMGYEALAEVVVSQLLKKSNVAEFVEYKPVLIDYDGKELAGCVSDSFRGKDEMLVPFERLHRAYQGIGLANALAKYYEPIDKIRYTVDFVEQVTGLKNVGAYLTMMLEIDAIFLNEDRHTNNLAVIRNEKTKQYRLCPVFDNGLALLSDLNDYSIDEDIYTCIGKVQAKPFDRSFDAQMEAAEELYGTQLRLQFDRRDVQDVLVTVPELYDGPIIDRVERVLGEQMRKYKGYFR